MLGEVHGEIFEIGSSLVIQVSSVLKPIRRRYPARPSISRILGSTDLGKKMDPNKLMNMVLINFNLDQVSVKNDSLYCVSLRRVSPKRVRMKIARIDLKK